MYGGSCNFALEDFVNCNEDVCCNDGDISTFNWDTLTENGIDIPEYNLEVFDVNENDLSLNIVVELDYLGDITGDDRRVGYFGVTYVLDFEDYDAHKDAINEPGTCQNRNGNDFNGVLWDDYWNFSKEPQNTGNVGSINYLAYPPPNPIVGEWDVYMKDDKCDTIVYEGKFTWTNLRNCKKYGGIGNSYTDIETDENSISLIGTFYINVVSPYSPANDLGFYRVYQILSQPFIITISSVVNVLGSTGINLMTLSVIAVYKEDQETDFKLVLLSECADYLKLTRNSGNEIFEFNPDDNNNGITTNDFNDNIDPENNDIDNECLNNKGFICSQLWEINAIDIGCTQEKGTDFSGNYKLSFVPECRDTGNTQLDTYCSNWLNDHPDIQTRVTLDTDLIWTDMICDPIIFTVQFVASMLFYISDNFDNGPIDDNHLYQVGEDTIYVEITTTFPDDTLNVFNVELVQVHICTFDPLKIVSNDPNDLTTFGCFGDRDTVYDEHFFKIYDPNSSPIIEEYDFNVITEGISNVVRFSFTVPNEVARDTLYVQAELEVELQELTRRRILISSGSFEPTSNQIESFVESVGINHGQKKPQPEPQLPQQYYPKEPVNPINPINSINPINPVSTWTIDLSSPWLIGIGSILGLIFIFNIGFMCYINIFKSSTESRVSFGKRKRGYKSVNAQDSEDFSESEAKAINVASE